MEQGEEFYALCRSYEKLGGGFFSSERRVTLGTREEKLIVQNFFLFRDKKNNPVVRLNYSSRDNGGIWGYITDSFEQKPVYVFIPLDDLVSLEGVVAPIGD